MSKERAGRIACMLVALLFLAAAGPKLMGAEEARTGFEHFGYSAGFMRWIGIQEALGAVLMMVPATVLVGAAILGVTMVGAVYTVLSVGESPVPAVVALLLVVLAAWLRREQAWWPRRP